MLEGKRYRVKQREWNVDSLKHLVRMTLNHEENDVKVMYLMTCINCNTKAFDRIETHARHQ